MLGEDLQMSGSANSRRYRVLDRLGSGSIRQAGCRNGVVRKCVMF